MVSHGTHSYCRNGGKLRLGILRSPTYATHEENIGPEFDRYLNRYMPRQEQGIRHAKFSFLFGDAAATTEATAKAAIECNVPLDPFVYFPTKRTVRPSRQSLASTSAENVLIVALKKAEEGDDLIVRLWETGGRATRFRLLVDGKTYPIKIGAWKLKTFRISREGIITSCNLIER